MKHGDLALFVFKLLIDLIDTPASKNEQRTAAAHKKTKKQATLHSTMS